MSTSQALVVGLFVAGIAIWGLWLRTGESPGAVVETAPLERKRPESVAAARPVAKHQAALPDGVHSGSGAVADATPAIAAAPTTESVHVPPPSRESDLTSESGVTGRRPSAITTEGVPAATGAAQAEAVARAALRFVGKDQAAEAIWLRAINDPDLPAGVRSDLIEDLNDEGYSDPDRATRADLPLILKRLELIERLAPFAMDDVNRAAFEEAYKDLLAMLIRLRGEKSRT